MNTLVSPDTVTNASGATQEKQPRAIHARTSRYAFSVFVVLLLATLLNGLDSSEFTGASAVIGRELHLSISDIGMLASAFTLFLTISIIPLGLLADRMRRSHVIAACLAVWSLATALTGMASNMVGLFLTRSFTGIGEAGYGPAGNSLVGDVFPEDQRGKVLSWLSLASVIGPLAGMVLGGVIAGLSTGSWKLLFLVTGIPGLLLAFFAWRLHEPARQTTGRLPDAAAQDTLKTKYMLAQLRSLLRIKTFVCLLIIGVLTTFTSTALQTFFPILLQQHDTFGMTSAQAGAYAGLLLGPTAIVGVILGGYLADWLTRRSARARLLIIIVSVLLTFPLNITSLLIANTHNIALFSAVMIPTFFVNTLHIAPLSAAFLDVVPSESRASAVAISLFTARILGSAVAPLAIGMLTGFLDPTGLHFLHNLAGHDIVLALLSTCPLAFIGAGIVGIIGLRWVHQDHLAAEGKVVEVA
ncbi:MAG: MFS transporter [Ktedonobacteraceae bacterium]